jgi:hypothetical protein
MKKKEIIEILEKNGFDTGDFSANYALLKTHKPNTYATKLSVRHLFRTCAPANVLELLLHISYYDRYCNSSLTHTVREYIDRDKLAKKCGYLHFEDFKHQFQEAEEPSLI